MGPKNTKEKVKMKNPSPLTINSSLPIVPKEFILAEFLEENQPKTINPQVYKDGNWEKVEPSFTQKSMKKASEIESLEIVTYNIWFGTRMETVEEIKPRITELMSIVRSKNPHIICLQGF